MKLYTLLHNHATKQIKVIYVPMNINIKIFVLSNPSEIEKQAYEKRPIFNAKINLSFFS